MIGFDLLLALPFSDLLTFLWLFVVLDVPRYLLAAIVTPWLLPSRPRRSQEAPRFRNATKPPVTGIIPCHNEERALPPCVASMRVNGVTRIIVVNDASTDRTLDVATTIPGIEIIDLPERQGKPDAINQALPQAHDAAYAAAFGEFVLVADADTSFADGSLVKALSYFDDPQVGGVGFNLRPSNSTQTLATRLQSIEYAISFGPARQLADMFGILSNVSGAAGLFRTSAIRDVNGWDTEVAEDAALAMKLRAAGWRLRYAPDATALTAVPTTMPALLEQRLRWDASIITIWFRKYRWLLDPLSPRYGLSPVPMKFRIANVLTVLDVLTFSAIMPIVLPIYLFVMFDRAGSGLADIFAASVIAMAAIDLFLVILIGLPPRLLIYWPWYFVVSLLVLRPLRVVALIAELVFRISHYDPYIPPHQRSKLT